MIINVILFVSFSCIKSNEEGCPATIWKTPDGIYHLNALGHTCDKDDHEKEEAKKFRAIAVQYAAVPGSGTPRNVFDKTSFR